jgi:CsoR family transcriptional regulator, copper-sensing transcriptional repressor
MAKLKDPIKKKSMKARLARVEGQLRAIQKQINDEADCEKVAQQLSAARKALDKAFFNLVACMIEQGGVQPNQIATMLAKFA